MSLSISCPEKRRLNLPLMNKSLKIECDINKLKDIRSFLELCLNKTEASEDEKGLMILAVDEICANVIIHSQGGDSSKFLEVKVVSDNEKILFEIIDTGKAFDPSSVSEPDIHTIVNEKRKGGMGLMLVKRIMDSIELVRENNYAVYRLTKKI